MTKHIVGLIIFTLIVGTSVVIAGLFGYSSAPDTYTFTEHHDNHRVFKKKKRKKRCRKKRRKHRTENIEAKISQAVFDKNTNQLTTNLVLTDDVIYGDVDLHFFVKDEFGTQYLKKETISVSSNGVYENSFAWLNRLESRENLYVIPKFKVSRRSWDYQPRFDVSKATPVTLLTAE